MRPLAARAELSISLTQRKIRVAIDVSMADLGRRTFNISGAEHPLPQGTDFAGTQSLHS